jgi:hypothetical protein
MMTSETPGLPAGKIMTPQALPLAVAVDRALTPVERAAFRARSVGTGYDGAEVADWIEDAVDSDAYLDVVEPWMDEHSWAALAELTVSLPSEVASALLWRAVYAWVPYAWIPETDLGGDKPRTPDAIARDAALWLRGYAEARGFEVQP